MKWGGKLTWMMDSCVIFEVVLMYLQVRALALGWIDDDQTTQRDFTTDIEKYRFQL